MRNRTVVAILTLALLLVGFIYFFERDTMTTTELEKRRGNVFKEFRRDQVEGLSIRGLSGEEISIEREVAEDTAEEKWRITSPRALEADDSEVRALLSALDYLLIGRTVKGEGMKADARFGLKNPRVKASFTMRGKKTSFEIGSDATGDKVYVAVDVSKDEVYAVDKEFLESFDKTVDDLRSKELVSRTLADATGVDVKKKDESYKLKREKDGPWKIEMGTDWILAAEDQVSELIRTVGDLQAEKFVADDVKDEDLGKWGLKEGFKSVVVSSPDGEKTEVRIGTPCPADEHQVYVHVVGTGTVVCADDGFLPVFERPKSRLEELHPVVLQDETVVAATLEKEGKTLTLEMDEEGWTLAGEEGPVLESDSVLELLKALEETKAEGLEVGEAPISGLGSPAATVTLTLAESDKSEKLLLFRSEKEDKELVRRDGENAVLIIPKGLIEKINPDVLAFRNRTITNGDQYDVEGLQIKGAAAQVLEKKDGNWKMVEPMEVAADGTAARELAGLIAKVEVRRFAAAKAVSAHGFDKPFAVVTARIAQVKEGEDVKDKTGSKDVVLEIGAVDKGSERFARLRGDDEVVFILGEEYERAVSTPMIARDLLQVDETKTKRLSLAVGAAEKILEREGEQWKDVGGQNVDSTKLKRLLTDLNGMKTLRAVSFGSKDADFKETTLVIKAWNEDQDSSGEPTIMTIGKKSDRPEEDGYLAKRSGIDATFAVPARIIDELAAFTVPPAAPTEPGS